MTKISQLILEVKLLKKEIKKSHLFRKRIYTIKEAAFVTGVSISQIQKLIASRKIPHSKPNGKLIFIRRKDLESFLMKNYIKSNDEIEMIVTNTILSNNKLN
ncbi:helix-turn-helix domain-containing protein [uncultured Winogradskyella sp.]|uniref:helix-turn-helix domain-containing protein n=1 Tax=uncultured Winogradskyella sp. TaxID=395353 RepID=UPI00262F0662|nr:helix-turn-helix domain-containing protein [uncultured Winogradskyella sp.]